MPEAGSAPTGVTSSRHGPVVVFDIDGTLLDSAEGIVAGFQHALRSVGFAPPGEAALRSDLGPPVDNIFRALGLPEARVEPAVLAYRTFYLAHGLQMSQPYAGVLDLLGQLRAAGVSLATATAKRTSVARAIIEHHRLSDFFEVVNGTDDLHTTKTATLGHTLELMGSPDRAGVVMVGDRHSDISAAHECGVLPVGVTWGYGIREELEQTRARLIDHPRQLLDVSPISAAVSAPTPVG